MVHSLVLLIFSVALAITHYNNITASSGRYRIDEQNTWQEFSFPFQINSPDAQSIQMEFTLHRDFLGPIVLRIIPDDCLERLSINGNEVTDPSLPFCDYTNGRVFRLGQYIELGKNQFTVTLHNAGGPGKLEIQTAATDPIRFTARSLVAITILLYLVLLSRFLQLRSWKKKYLAGVYRRNLATTLLFFYDISSSAGA